MPSLTPLTAESTGFVRRMERLVSKSIGIEIGVVNAVAVVVVIVTAVKGFSLLDPNGDDQQRRQPHRGRHADGALHASDPTPISRQLHRENPASLTQRFTTDFTFVKEALTRLINIAVRDVHHCDRAGGSDVLDRLADDARRAC